MPTIYSIAAENEDDSVVFADGKLDYLGNLGNLGMISFEKTPLSDYPEPDDDVYGPSARQRPLRRLAATALVHREPRARSLEGQEDATPSQGQDAVAGGAGRYGRRLASLETGRNPEPNLTPVFDPRHSDDALTDNVGILSRRGQRR